MQFSKDFVLVKGLIFLIVFCLNPVVWAGFLELPTIEELPEKDNEPYLSTDMDIPEVMLRNYDPQFGPRVNVTQFRIQGIVEYPELGITREKLIKLVEDIRFTVMGEGEERFAGFSQDEVGELGQVIEEIEKTTRGQPVTSLDVQRLVFKVRELHRQRGVTLGMLESIADQITLYYRQRGFFLAKAFVPEQHVRDGVVTLTLMLGELGETPLQNSRLYSQQVIDRIFEDVRDKPVTHKVIEQKLFLLNDLPGLRAQGFFSRGDQVGDTTLNINAISEKRFDLNVRVDNHGSDSTGEYRLYGNAVLNNPLGYGDYLAVSALAASRPEDSTFGALSYGGPLFNHRWQYNLSASRNAFTLALEQGNSENFGIGGVSNEYSARVDYMYKRSRINTSFFSLGLSHIDASLRYITENRESEFNHDVTENTFVAFNFDVLREKSRTIHTGMIELIYSRVLESLLYNNELFDDIPILRAQYTQLNFIPMPFGWSNTRLVSRVNLQYAGKQLLSVNQFGLAGPTRARAFKTNTFFADDGIHAGLEWIFDLPFEFYFGSLQPYVLADLAYGETHLPGDDDINRADLADAGVGVKVLAFNAMRGNFSIAKSLRSRISNDIYPERSDGWKVYTDFQYSF